ncbi:hypothetical protein [Mesorhizobium sp. J428]|uniref:hypothetical protein n=1 Tax=Mesorhizobium sp. J428 TaxID=2898440 RepID=UPI0021514272|nr:hypothetical protein [Mesorhizobium sp. J428]MCR5856912.1 hypothetical protein [Mesorhizobium sp. J428]
MGDTANMPPLSGEIMAGDAPRDAQTQTVAGADVVDAEFVTIPRSPAVSAFAAPDTPTVRPIQPPAGMDVLTAKATQGVARAGPGLASGPPAASRRRPPSGCPAGIRCHVTCR